MICGKGSTIFIQQRYLRKIESRMYFSITKRYLSENTPHHKNTVFQPPPYLHAQYNTTYYELRRANYSGNTEEKNNGYVVFK